MSRGSGSGSGNVQRGEAGAQTGAGDDTMPAILLVAKNRFGDPRFLAGATPYWQSVLNPTQFAGLKLDAAKNATNGVTPELGYAAAVYDGTTSVSIPAGCNAYWSPTDSQYSAVSNWVSTNANAVSDSAWGAVGAPDLWRGQAKQAVIKSSIANNVLFGRKSAPAIVLFRLAASGTDPAIVTIP